MKKIDPTKFLRPEVKKFKPYTPSQTLEQISKEVKIPVKNLIKLDTGENPYIEEYKDKTIINKIRFYSYPDPLSLELREKLADYTGFSKEWILCGNGSDELLDLLIRAFVAPNEEIIINPPTFPMYEFSAQLSGAKVKSILRNPDFSIDANRVIKNITKKTKLVFIESPGNPTGAIIPQETFEKILKSDVMVVGDEAYFEYCNKTVLPLLKKYPNLIVVRTLSKWAGIAGLRVGYVVASPEIVSTLLAIKQPYNVSSVGQAFACYMLDNRKKVLAELKKITTYRDSMFKMLSKFGNLIVFPSQGSYVVVKPKEDSEKLFMFLRKNGILVKKINQPLLENSFRINVAKNKEISKMEKVFKSYYLK